MTEPRWKRLTRFKARKLMDGLLHAYDNGIDQPTFRAAGLTFGLRRVGVQGYRGTGSISIARMAPVPAFLGRVVIPTGRFIPSQHCKQADLGPIRAVIEHPLTAARVHAAAIPVCACCGRPLGLEDQPTGIGPVCLEKWGWAK